MNIIWNVIYVIFYIYLILHPLAFFGLSCVTAYVPHFYPAHRDETVFELDTLAELDSLLLVEPTDSAFKQ